MLPDALLLHSIRDGRLLPHFLGEQDHPWLRVLIDEFDRLVGKPQRDLDQRLRAPLPCYSPEGKQRLAAHVISRLGRSSTVAAVPPRVARSALFVAAAGSTRSPSEIVSTVARGLEVADAQLMNSLFADLPGERLVREPASPISPVELALRCNLALAQGFLFRSTAVRISLEGNARAVVRHARLRGLLCAVSAGSPGERSVLEISGPFSLFRHTLLYGRRLAELIPILLWCARYRLDADCVVRDRAGTLRLVSGDPIAPSAEPRRYDSKLEERFARDFGRLAADWELLREPEPAMAGSSGVLLFPDFALTHRRDPSRRWLLEIVGFWTPEYLRNKLERYRVAALANLILCVDETLACVDSELPISARIIRFRRRVDAAAVLRLIEA